jgi:hypothetical protein
VTLAAKVHIESDPGGLKCGGSELDTAAPGFFYSRGIKWGGGLGSRVPDRRSLPTIGRTRCPRTRFPPVRCRWKAERPLGIGDPPSRPFVQSLRYRDFVTAPRWAVPFFQLDCCATIRRRRGAMGHSHYGPAAQSRPAWNVGKTVGTKRPMMQRKIGLFAST